MKEYYKPEFSEFHQGFEYEMEVHGSKPTKWIKLTWSEFDSPQEQFDFKYDNNGELTQITIPDCIRVKHLSREDIESLGWNKSLNDDRMCYKDIKHRGELKIARILMQKTHCLIYISGLSQKFSEGDTIFSGTIKNLSVLKQVLKMII